MSSQKRDAGFSVRVQDCNNASVRRADLNWASHLFVGNVWWTPRYLDVYVRPVESPFDFEDLLTFWTPCLVKGSVCIPALCIRCIINLLFSLDSMMPVDVMICVTSDIPYRNASSCVSHLLPFVLQILVLTPYLPSPIAFLTKRFFNARCWMSPRECQYSSCPSVWLFLSRLDCRTIACSVRPCMLTKLTKAAFQM